MNIHRKSGLFSAALGAVLAAVIFLTGCHHPVNDFPEEHPGAWTPTDVETMLGGDDPMETWNRTMFSCTDFLMNYVADPVGRVYTSIFPRPFVEHFNNLCVNLEFPARALSTLLRAEWRAAGDETLRFLINTTIGIVGIFDVAQSWFHIPSSDADFGSTFAHWGIGSGHSFVLPIVPSLNGRDLLGLIFDSIFDIKSYIPYAGYATLLNRMVISHSAYDSVSGDALDPYKNFRQILLLRKELQIRLWFYHRKKSYIEQLKAADNAKVVKPQLPEKKSPKPEHITAKWQELPNYYSQDPVTDSLRMMMFQPQTDFDKWYMPRSLFDSSFSAKRSIYDLTLCDERPEARYGFYPRSEVKDKPLPKMEELVLLLPGIGGTLDNSGMRALAEIFHQRNCNVAVFDSTFNWRFILADSAGKLPGYLPDDAARVRKLLNAALDDLQKRGLLNRKNTRITLAGYSLGGLHTLKIAELEKISPQLGITNFIAINPPVSLRHALTRIDELANASANWSKSKMLDKLTDTAGNAFILFSKRFKSFDGKAFSSDYQISFDPETANVIAGLYLRLCLRDVLLASHRENPLPGLPEFQWGRRHALYQAIDKVTMKEYAEKFLARDYPGKSVDELLAASELKAFADTIKDHPGVRIFHNYDDFLLSEDERRFLDRSFSGKLTWFSNGGHLGNLYYLPVQSAIQ